MTVYPLSFAAPAAPALRHAEPLTSRRVTALLKEIWESQYPNGVTLEWEALFLRLGERLSVRLESLPEATGDPFVGSYGSPVWPSSPEHVDALRRIFQILQERENVRFWTGNLSACVLVFLECAQPQARSLLAFCEAEGLNYSSPYVWRNEALKNGVVDVLLRKLIKSPRSPLMSGLRSEVCEGKLDNWHATQEIVHELDVLTRSHMTAWPSKKAPSAEHFLIIQRLTQRLAHLLPFRTVPASFPRLRRVDDALLEDLLREWEEVG
jgi:hypothetical protein